MAPEIIFGKDYDLNADIWSFGTMLYEFLFGIPPFKGKNEKELKQNLIKGVYVIPAGINISVNYLDLIGRCLIFNPKDRLTHEELLEHPFLKEEIKESEYVKVSLFLL